MVVRYVEKPFDLMSAQGPDEMRDPLVVAADVRNQQRNTSLRECPLNPPDDLQVRKAADPTLRGLATDRAADQSDQTGAFTNASRAPRWTARKRERPLRPQPPAASQH